MAAVLLHLCFAFVLGVCTIFPPVIGGRCPSSCSCLGNNVDCSKRGLIKIPTDIEPWVTRLELQSNGINQIQHDDFKRLSNLTHLDLSNNEISVINGTVFRDLINLKTLLLDNNKMTQIPRFPVPMNITHLSMRENHVVTIPLPVLQALPKIEHLDLTNNYILSLANGSFPVGCPLKTLNLNNNKISAIEAGCLNNLTVLEALKLNGNKLTDLPSQVFNKLAKLKTLEMMRNKLRVIPGLAFNGLVSLHVLKLKRNNIGALKDGAFYGLDHIANLQMDRNRITNITKGWMYGLNNLRQLTLSYNHISNIETGAWLHKSVEKLNLTHNRLTAITEHSFALLRSLRSLYLDNNRIFRIDDGAFRDLGKLSSLQLNHNEISWTMEDLPGAFRGLSGLTRLGLRHNEIRSVAVHTFSGLPKLRQLLLEDNDITSMKENVFETLRNLRDLRFNTTKLFCDCHLSWLPVWLQHNGLQTNTHGTCHHPAVLRGVDMYKVDPKQLTCTKLPKPIILESPKSGNGYKGENLTLSCTVGMSGDNQPVIHWKKDNMPLGDENMEIVATTDGEVSRFTAYLHLVNIQDSMGGGYQCMASNDFGSVFSQKAYIKVYVYPSFTKKPKNITVKVGKHAELKCAATGKPQPVISWQKDGGVSFPAARERRMQVYPDDDRFFIMNTRLADEGVYSCMAKSEAGMIVYNATVTVLETPDFVKAMPRKKKTKQGETTVLQCMASGTPQPKLRWMKDSEELVVTPRHFFTVDNQLLVIVETKPSDSGIYSCRLSNSLGTVRGTTHLQVLAASEGSGEDSSDSSFGLDDESTTTGIIIIAVVCCVVGTSLVWVIIIYQTRKRHEVYSATPTDETTLPVEVPSSGYMSSDKEGSYTPGGAPPSYYYYQDYQMKESGYESSSGQYRVNNGHARTMAMFAHDDDDEDDQNPPVVTAGDRLLQQFKDGHHQSKSSLHYPVSDGEDTIGSRHSSSSGQHSGTSNSSTGPPSSHNSAGQSSTASGGDHHQHSHSSHQQLQHTPQQHHHHHHLHQKQHPLNSASSLLSSPPPPPPQHLQPLTIITKPTAPASADGKEHDAIHSLPSSPHHNLYANDDYYPQHPHPSHCSSNGRTKPSTSSSQQFLHHPHNLQQQRPVHLQTFHPTKQPTNHDRLNRSFSTSWSLGRRREEEEEEGAAAAIGKGCGGIGCDSNNINNNYNNTSIGKYGPSGVGRERHHSDSCDNNRDFEYEQRQHPRSYSPSSSSASPCAACHAMRTAGQGVNSVGGGVPHSSSNGLRQIRSPLSSSRSDNNVHNSVVSPSSSPSQKHQGVPLSPPPSYNNCVPHYERLEASNTLPSSSSSKLPKSLCTDCNNSSSSSPSYHKLSHNHSSSPSPPPTCSHCGDSATSSSSSHHTRSPTPSSQQQQQQPLPKQCSSCGSNNTAGQSSQSSLLSSPSTQPKPMKRGARTRSSSSVGQGDPMYFAIQDHQCHSNVSSHCRDCGHAA